MIVQRVLFGLYCVTAVEVVSAEPSQLARELAAVSPGVLSDAQRKKFKDQTWRHLRARGDVVNRRDVSKWAAIQTRTDWERLRKERLRQLRIALGDFPPPPQMLDVRITKQLDGDGFVVQNLIYQTRRGMWVTANLYRPSTTDKKMPGLLIAHSHHRPKTQGELQDMGMTWARQGCLVLVIDQIGHGERADHPFQSERDFSKPDSGFRWWRQDYYYRFDINAQLHLVGQSLMGWMVWDLMRGVDMLLAQPNIDPDKIIILGAVAGGGDPAAVTAALDRRIDAAVPFNFGGPQPETHFPLPENADLHFDYLGGAYWEGTRNLRRSGVDGFFHWLIVASTAPRPLLYAHEFAWDKERDPVWKRLNRIYAFYDATDKIDYVTGYGNVKLKPSQATHCTNIGRTHRERIHLAFKRWFDIDVTQDHEYSMRLAPPALRSMSDQARRDIKPKKLFEILSELGRERVNAARERSAKTTASERRRQMQSDWKQLLGDIQPGNGLQVLSRKSATIADNSIVIERVALQTEPGMVVPIVVLSPNRDEKTPSRVVVAVSQSGKEKFLRQRSREIAELLTGGATVCLLDVRGAGRSRGSRGELDSASYYALFFETPLLGYRLRDLRAGLQYLRTRNDSDFRGFVLWGDSFAPPNPKDTDFQVPRRVNGRPRFSEPLGGLLAMLGALYEDDVTAVYCHGGLSCFHDVLTSPYVYLPHDLVIPGVLTKGDLADLAASLAPCLLRLDGVVDGLNRTLALDVVHSIYKPAIRTYESYAATVTLTANRSNTASWLLNAVGK